MVIPVLPHSAPFSPEQRAWLNGFFAGVYGTDAGATISADSGSTPAVSDTASLSLPAVVSDVLPSVSPGAPTFSEEEEMPWHDPALSLEERMQMAQGKPLAARLMAAMAQLNCGQCGYVCKTYAQAIADGTETSLRKCVPGEKPTFLKLKELAGL